MLKCNEVLEFLLKGLKLLFFSMFFKTSAFYVQGHAAPVLYAAWAEAGLLSEADLLNLRKIDSDLEGHPTPVTLLLHYI